MNTKFGPDILNGKGTFTVPADYNHDKWLDEFAEKARNLKKRYYYNAGLTSKNFLKATNKLVPGKTYGIKLFSILEKVKSEECLSFLKSANAIFFGAHGITALQVNQPDVFSPGRCIYSFDEKEALSCFDGRSYLVPSINRRLGGGWEFCLSNFENTWLSGEIIICFYELG